MQMATTTTDYIITFSSDRGAIDNWWYKQACLGVERVIFNDPATIVIWNDGDKTVVKCMEGDTFDEHVGFQAAVTKKVFGSHCAYNRIIAKAQRTQTKGE